jgi:hypothetical protein
MCCFYKFSVLGNAGLIAQYTVHSLKKHTHKPGGDNAYQLHGHSIRSQSPPPSICST